MKNYKIHLIRHGMTEANETGLYIGTTDLPLSPAGLRDLLDKKEDEVPMMLVLTQTERDAVQDFTGQLPPYTRFKNLEYKLFQLGLTAVEYPQK